MSELVPTRAGRVSTEPAYSSPVGFNDPQSQAGDAIDIVGLLYRKKWLVAAGFLVVTIPAGIAMYLEIPLYRSSALLQINSNSVQVLPYNDVADIVPGSSNSESMMRTQEELLNSVTLTARVAQRLNDARSDSPASAKETCCLSERFNVQRIEASQLFRVSYLAPDPNVAKSIVDLYTEEFIKHHFEVRQHTREKAREHLERELIALEDRVQVSEAQLVNYAKRNNMMKLAPEGSDLVHRRQEILEQEVAEAEVAYVSAKARVELAQKVAAEQDTAGYPSQLADKLRGQLFELENKLTGLRSQFGESWPAVIRTKAELALVKDQLGKVEKGARARVTNEAEIELLTAGRKYKAMLDSAAQQKTLVERHNEASVQYNILRREVETNEKLYEGMLERLKQTSVMTGFEFGNIEVLEAGIIPGVPDTPNVLWNMSLASLLGLGIGFCLVFLTDYWDNSIATTDELVGITRLPVLGSIPSTKDIGVRRPLLVGPAKPSSGKAVLIQPKGPEEPSGTPASAELVESVRSLCTSILLSQSERPPRVILITSPSPGEGKTTITQQLGIAFAESGSPTLLVEADLRMPALAAEFSLDPVDGLSLYLSGHVSSWPNIHATGIDNLSIATAGPPPPNPVALLNSEKMSKFLAHAASQFRYILLDSPPILTVADARMLSIRSDGVVLVARAHRTSKKDLEQAEALLQQSGASVLGVVLNACDRHRPSSRYYDRYRHYGYKA